MITINIRTVVQTVTLTLAMLVVGFFITTTTVQAAGTVNAEDFATVNGSYKGISVGFNTDGFGTTTAVKVEMTREDGSVVTKNANEGVLAIINNPNTVGVAQLTAPFVIQEGAFIEGEDTLYWDPAPADWSIITRPVSVKITITDESGETNVINSSLTESGTTYSSLLVSPNVVHVSNQNELEMALDNDTVTSIILDDSFMVTTKLLIDHPVTIDGKNHTISSDIANPTVWNSSKAYIFQLYNTAGVVIKDIKLTSANAALLINGTSTASLEGTVDVSGNGFGGIESSNGSVLTVSGATLVNTTEAYGRPTLWEDGTTGATVVGFGTAGNTTIKPTQVQYYLGSTSVVRNEAQLNAALSDSSIPVITVAEDFTLAAAVTINRTVTIEGGGHTLTAESSVVNNALLITAPNVTIKNLIVDGANKNIHGIQAYRTTNVSLEGVTVRNNGKSGITVNGSTMIVTNITTTDNGWGGINVDQGSGVTDVTTLTVNGTSVHTEVNADIWRDDNTKTNVTVVDTNSQYDASEYTHDTSIIGTQYFLKAVVVEEPRRNSGGGGSRRRTTSPPAGEVLGASTSANSPSTPIVYYNFTVNLTVGSRGVDVTNLQAILIAAGYLQIAAPTGYFGPLTQAAVKLYQAAHGIPNTGFVGPLTRASLNTIPMVRSLSAETIKKIADILAQIAVLQAALDRLK